YNARQPILDGNVKRVFCRYYGIEGETQKKATENILWEQAWQHLDSAPDDVDMAAYTQGLMHLGAALCTRSKPACARCRLAARCVARRDGRQAQLPTARQRKVVPQRQVCVLILEHNEQILMYRRADKGIWGGLLTLPEFVDRMACTTYLRHALGEHTVPVTLAAFEHVFTHFRLHIEPALLHAPARPTVLPAVDDDDADQPSRWQWVDVAALSDAALPAPLRKLLTGYFDENSNRATATPRL